MVTSNFIQVVVLWQDFPPSVLSFPNFIYFLYIIFLT